MNRLENPYPRVLDHECSYRIQYLFLAIVHHFLNIAVNPRKKTAEILISFEFFFIKNPLMDRSSHFDLVR